MKVVLAFLLSAAVGFGGWAHGSKDARHLLRRALVENNESIENPNSEDADPAEMTEPPLKRDLLTCPSTYQACSSRPLLQRSTVYQSAAVDLQCMLNSKNSAGLTVDGYFGSLTETAVKNWQTKNYLKVDGIVGPNTWISLCVSCLEHPPGWYDSDGSNYGCAWYAEGGNCAYGGAYANMGFTAKQACCACGGGCRPEHAPTSLTYDSVKAAVLRKGYTFFTGKYNLNLIAIRGPNRCSDAWDDTFCVLYQDENLQNRIRIFSRFTTDPGKKSLELPPNSKGCAIVAPGQYRAVWENGLHQGSYPALVQVGSIDVYRDNNKNDYLNFVGRESQSGIGINLHHANSALTVGENSAGCQVLQKRTDLSVVLALTAKQKAYGYGSTFTYTLLQTGDIY